MAISKNGAIKIGVISGKGGVGKTTTSVNLAAAYAALELKTLLVDMVPGGTIATHLGIKTVDIGVSSLAGPEAENAIQRVAFGALAFDVVPSDLRTYEKERDFLTVFIEKPLWLKDLFADWNEKYDIVIFDSPPGTSPITVGIVAAAGIPLCICQAEYQSLNGCAAAVGLARTARREYNTTLEQPAVLVTMLDHRIRHSRDAIVAAGRLFGEMMLENYIPRNVALADAFLNGIPGIIYSASSAGPQAYLRTAAEIAQRYRF